MSFTSGAQWVCSFHYSFFFLFSTYLSFFFLSLPFSPTLTFFLSLSFSQRVIIIPLCSMFLSYLCCSLPNIHFFSIFLSCISCNSSFVSLPFYRVPCNLSLLQTSTDSFQLLFTSLSTFPPPSFRPLANDIPQSVFPVFLVDYSSLVSSDHPKTVRSTNLSRTIEIEWTAYARNSPTSIYNLEWFP